jgi:Uma2 family endonuclease
MTEPAYVLPRQDDGQSWPQQGEWTYEDYLRLPDDGQRYEVIRGFLYVTASPTYKHQYVAGRFYRQVDAFVEDHRLGVVLMAPFDVLLPFGIGTPVEPDVVFFRAGNEPHWEAKNFQGVPDLVAEVLSPKTRRRDQKVKLEAYRDAGVPEYWMLDPDSRRVVVHVLRSRTYAELCRGGIDDEVWSSVLPGFRLKVVSLFPPSPDL